MRWQVKENIMLPNSSKVYLDESKVDGLETYILKWW